MFVPAVGIASHGRSVTNTAVVDGEVQRYGAVAAVQVGVLEDMFHILCCSYTCVLVPVVCVACHRRSITHTAVVDSEV